MSETRSDLGDTTRGEQDPGVIDDDDDDDDKIRVRTMQIELGSRVGMAVQQASMNSDVSQHPLIPLILIRMKHCTFLPIVFAFPHPRPLTPLRDRWVDG